jgi:hypothetical protein
MFLMTGVSLSALTPGVRLNIGLSGGVGEGWNEVLDDAGNRDFNDALPCAGFSVFTDLPMEEGYLFAPELGFAVNRGARLSNKDGDSVEMAVPFLMELLLPLARDFESAGGNRAFRVMGGIQLQYGFGLEVRTNVDGHEETIDPENQAPLAAGIVLGTGLEFGRQKERSWFLDLRLKIPFSDTISYDSGDRGRYHISDSQLMLGGGFKFH